jgi:hypothetical protein
MSKNDEYRANAAECERMARFTRNESEKRTWQDMAESWLRLIQPSSAAVSDRFDAMDLDQGARASAGFEHWAGTTNPHQIFAGLASFWCQPHARVSLRPLSPRLLARAEHALTAFGFGCELEPKPLRRVN